MRVGEGGEALCDEIHGRLERRLLLGTIVAPKRLKRWPLTIQVGKPEQELQSAVDKRISFHVKEEISGARPWQSCESLAVNGRQQLVAGFGRGPASRPW